MPHEVGFGCMGFSAFYKSARNTSEEEALQVLLYAYERGVRLFNTATFYGPLNEAGFGANLRLLKKFLERVDRSQVRLMVKVGMDTRAPVEKTGQVWNNRADAEGLRADIDYALETLGTDYIDIVVLCRVSPVVPIEESVRALQTAVNEGKARHIGLSEASASTLQRALAVAPIEYIEQEWSLWTRDIEEEVVPICKANGIKIVAYSPLGRGFLTGTIRSRNDEAFDPYDFRLMGQPRFSEENFDQNLRLVDGVSAIAARRGVTCGQIALAWLFAQTNLVIPIPGTTKAKHLDENLDARDIDLTAEELAEIEEIYKSFGVIGDRYAHMAMTFHGNK